MLRGKQKGICAMMLVLLLCLCPASAARVQAESPVVDRWNEYMKDVMLMEMDPETGAQPLMKQVFFFD